MFSWNSNSLQTEKNHWLSFHKFSLNDDPEINALNSGAAVMLNERGCVLLHKCLKALKATREYMTLDDNGVREKFEDDEEVVYQTTSTECTCTFFCNDQSPCRHIILLKRGPRPESLSSVFHLSLFHTRYHKGIVLWKIHHQYCNL